MSAPAPVTASGTVTASGHIEVTGSIPNSVYTSGDLLFLDVYYNGVDEGSALAGNGTSATYDITTSSTFSDGTYTLSVVEQDPNDTSPSTTLFTVTVGVTAPPTPEPSPTITGLGPESAGSPIEVSGTGTADDLVTLYVGSAVVGTGLVNASGTFDITTTSTFGTGTYTLTAIDSHADGTDPSAASTPVTFTVASSVTYFANDAASLEGDLADVITAGSGTIDFAPGVTEIDLTSTLVITSGNITIDPDGPPVVLNGNGHTVLDVSGGSTLTLDDMTITGGSATGAAGSGGGTGGNAAGGIYVSTGGTLILNNSFVVNNSATGGAGGSGDSTAGGAGGFAGGGIFAASGATVIATNSVIANNYAKGGAGGTGGQYSGGGAGGFAAGGIYLAPSATFEIGSSDSFFNNSAIGGMGGQGGANTSGLSGGAGGMGYLATEGNAPTTAGATGSPGNGNYGGSGGIAGAPGGAGFLYSGQSSSSVIFAAITTGDPVFVTGPGGGGGGGDAWADYSGMATMVPDAPTHLMQVGAAGPGDPIEVSGIGTPGDTIELYIDGGTTAVGSTTLSPSGDGSFTITTTQTFDTGVYTLTATDTSSATGLTSAMSGAAYRTLASFPLVNGNASYVQGQLAQDNAGDIFGTTKAGGAYGAGSVFEIKDTNGVFSGPITLASFKSGSATGNTPFYGVTLDASGNLFGVTSSGAAFGAGAVFEITNTSGTYATTPLLVAAIGTVDGEPLSGLVADATGDLFGETNYGSGGYGEVYELVNTSGTYSAPEALASFNSSDGTNPFGGLYIDSAGNLFGTTELGGTSNDGSVFEITYLGSGTYATVPETLASFNGTDGVTPTGNLIADANGDLFGTTEAGGQGALAGSGVVFEIASTGSGTYSSTPTVIADLASSTAGIAEPISSLVMDTAGDLYGLTALGGASSGGVLYEIANLGGGAYLSTPIVAAGSIPDDASGSSPGTGLLIDAAGNIYGESTDGGASGGGTVFQFGLPTAVVGSTAVVATNTLTQVGTAQNGQTIEVSGSGGTSGDSVTVYAMDNGNTFTVGTATVSGDGTFDINSTPTTFADGTYTLSEYDNTASGPVAVTGTAIVTATPPTDLAQVGTTSAGGTIEITGNGDATGDTVTLYNGTAVVGSGTVNGDGTFDITTPTTFAEGIYRLTATNTSQDGTETSPIAVLNKLADLDYPTGANPQSGLIMDAAGDLFGTANYGGGAAPDGTVFEIPSGGGTPIALATFTGTSGDGASPVGGLVADAAGDLFGTTSSGGANGFGTVFEIPLTSGTYGPEATIASFTGSGGSRPEGTLIIDGNGDLFGTTSTGGAHGDGTVFELVNTSGVYGAPEVLKSFSGGSGDGANPLGGLVADANGDLFGTTASGGTGNAGTVFELVNASGSYTEQVLASFNYTNGIGPASSLVIDRAGDVFGTTPGGGANQDGTVFEVAAGSGIITDVVSFNGTDGSDPIGGLTIDAAGNLYGTTLRGGTNGDGTVFEVPYTVGGSMPVYTTLEAPEIEPILPNGGYASTPIVLASLDGTDGTAPSGALLLDGQGNLYGTTSQGGANGDGTVFQVATNGLTVDVPPDAPTNITQVGTASNGQMIEVTGSATVGDTVTVYATDNGTTMTVGTGTVNASGTFDITSTSTFADGTYTLTATDTSAANGLTSAPSPASGTLLQLADFNGSDGGAPTANLIADANGDLFGTTSTGGPYGGGTVFEITDTDGVFSAPVTLAGAGGSGSAGNEVSGTTINAGLVIDAAGDLFGTTEYGPSSGGTVFELVNTSGTYSPVTLANLPTGYNGGISGLSIDAAGDLFGTVSGDGASGGGTVFELVNTSGTYSEQVVDTFGSGGAAGYRPEAGVITDAAGNLFGTTEYGGSGGGGTVFELVNNSGNYTEQVLTSFQSNGSGGSNPRTALVMDAAGDLFGTTSSGGSDDGGTIYELVNSSGSYGSPITIAELSSSAGTTNIALDEAGNLFGTLRQGGDANAGEVFEISAAAIKQAVATGTPASLTALASFNGSGGAYPNGVTIGANDILFGTTEDDGNEGGSQGTVFEYIPTPTAIVSANAPVIATVGSASNGGTITVTGTADDADGDTITIYSGTAVVGTGTLTSGTFSVTTSTFADGTYSLTATDTSVDGTEISSASIAATATVLATPPVNLAENGSSANGQTISFTGTGDAPGDTVTIYNGSTVVGSGTVSGGGTFYITTNSTFADGTYTFDATNTSADGTETSSASVATTVVVAAPPPTGPLQVGTTVSGDAAVVTGYGDVTGDTITLYSGSTVVGSGTVSGDGTYTITTTSTFADGVYNLTATDTSVDGTVTSGPSNYALKILATFAPGVGSNANLIGDAKGDLFGTTYNGGSGGNVYNVQLSNDRPVSGDGTVFELTPNGDGSYTNTTLYSFSGGQDGAFPESGLIADAAGDLFGTTTGGGVWDFGTVYELTPNGSGGYTKSTLFSFNGEDGYDPAGNLTLDASGNIYGSTYYGGGSNFPLSLSYYDYGGVDFELTPTGSGTYSESTIIDFSNESNAFNAGVEPLGSLLDLSGTLIGANYYGFMTAGVVYAALQTAAGDQPVPLAYFPYTFGSGDNASLFPSSGVIADAAGDLFGESYTSTQGGSSDGTVYEIPKTANGGYGTPLVLATFDNANPASGLVIDAKGNLYGTTYDGGTADDGTVFEIAYLGSGTYAPTPTTLLTFNGADGVEPDASLFIGADGGLYGTTYGDGFGSGSSGTVFEILPATVTVVPPAPTNLVQQNVQNTVNGGTIEVTGSGETGDTVLLYNGTTVVGSGVVTSGTFDIVTTSTFADGAYTLTATETNAGLTSESSAPLTAYESADLFGAVTHSVTSVGGEVYALYETILGRAPDATGLENFVAEVNSGTPLTTVAQVMLSSPEYTADYGANSQNSNSKFVTQLYEDGLHREPDGPGLQNYDNMLQSGADTRAQIAVAIATSPESDMDLASTFSAGVFVPDASDAAVARLYYGLLGRTPDTGGLEGWEQLVHGGSLTISQVAQDMLASPEYEQATGVGQSNQQYVTGLYQTALGRAPDQSGFQTYVQGLDTGTFSRADVVSGFLSSNEFQNETLPDNNAMYINEVYEVALGRQADPDGLHGWEVLMANGLSRSAFDQDIVASQEFANNVTTPSQAAFVNAIYEGALGRSADTPGLQGWEAILSNGGSTGGITAATSVAVGIAESTEAQNHLAPRIETGFHVT